jgi:hypothetical protein
MKPPFGTVRGFEREELERAEATHELTHRGSAAVRRAGLSAQLAMHGRQIRKDRGELPRHGRGLVARRGEEEFGALARVADAAKQFVDAVHGAQATRASRAGPTPCATSAL